MIHIVQMHNLEYMFAYRHLTLYAEHVQNVIVGKADLAKKSVEFVQTAVNIGNDVSHSFFFLSVFFQIVLIL